MVEERGLASFWGRWKGLRAEKPARGKWEGLNWGRRGREEGRGWEGRGDKGSHREGKGKGKKRPLDFLLS